MMKYFENDDGTVALSSLWAYEGVVLPGGKVIVGRWWAANDDPAVSSPPSTCKISLTFIPL